MIILTILRLHKEQKTGKNSKFKNYWEKSAIKKRTFPKKTFLISINFLNIERIFLFLTLKLPIKNKQIWTNFLKPRKFWEDP